MKDDAHVYASAGSASMMLEHPFNVCINALGEQEGLHVVMGREDFFMAVEMFHRQTGVMPSWDRIQYAALIAWDGGRARIVMSARRLSDGSYHEAVHPPDDFYDGLFLRN